MKTYTLNRYFAVSAIGVLAVFGALLSYMSVAHAATNISNIVATPSDTGATISWSTDTAGDTQVLYGTSAGTYSASSTLGTTPVTSHVAFLGGLTPNTTYHFSVQSNDASGTLATSSDQTFLTLSTVIGTTTGTTTGTTGSTTTGTTTTTGTSTPSTGDLSSLITALENLRNLFPQFAGQILGIINQLQAGNTIGNPASSSIDNTNGTWLAGGAIDFSGRNFGHEEQVNVMQGGNLVTTAHADGGGNFSTGSLHLPTTPGTYTYTFNGATSGISVSTTVTVQ